MKDARGRCGSAMSAPADTPRDLVPKVFRFDPIDLHIYSRLTAEGGRWLAEHYRKASDTYLLIRFYLNGTILQFNRMVEDLNESNRLMSNPRVTTDLSTQQELSRSHERYEMDIHFYLVCWDKLAKFYGLYERLWNRPVLTAVLQPVRKTLNAGSRARNYFEHLDDRIERDRFRSRGSGMAGSSFSFGYEERTAKGATVHRQVTLGRAEILRVIAADAALANLVELWARESAFSA
jgi:hypothetical protein